MLLVQPSTYTNIFVSQTKWMNRTLNVKRRLRRQFEVFWKDCIFTFAKVQSSEGFLFAFCIVHAVQFWNIHELSISIYLSIIISNFLWNKWSFILAEYNREGILITTSQSPNLFHDEERVRTDVYIMHVLHEAVVVVYHHGKLQTTVKMRKNVS